MHGAGCINRLPKLLRGQDPVLVVTDKGLVAAGIVEQVTRALDAGGIAHVTYDGVLGNPPARCVNAGLRMYTREKCASILAVGGGSAMDAAKMIGIVATNGGRIEKYLGPNTFSNDLPTLICVPTTYGTGSEVTPFAVLTDIKGKTKDPIISWRIAPQTGLLDPELVVALPASVGAPTGMDALTHALESYVSLVATPLTDALAIEAIRLIGENIRLACANDHELEASERMLIASAMAGMAFSQTRLGNVHAMSHPVGAHFNVHHGTANAILLPYVMEFNLPARLDKFADIGIALGGDDSAASVRESAEEAIDLVRELNADLNIPETLDEVGVKATSVPAMSRSAMASGNIQVNPRKTSLNDIVELFKQAI
jgi:alcohol dehydrogenase